MGRYSRYERYERGSPLADCLAGHVEGVIVTVVCLAGMVLGAVLIAARLAPEPAAQTQPAPKPAPGKGSIEERHREAAGGLEAARRRGDADAVRRFEHELESLQREHYDTHTRVLTDEKLRRYDEASERFQKSITDPRRP